MYIIQMADLHIGSKDGCGDKESTILSKAIDSIEADIPKGEDLLVCVCGDVIDSKKLKATEEKEAEKRYEEAAELFRMMIRRLEKEHKIKFRFCLGNHDVTHINEFRKFVEEFDSEITKERIEDGYFFEWNGICCVFLNSCNGGQYEYGCLDYEKLKKLMDEIPEDVPKLLVLHHTVISMYSEDDSAIKDVAPLLNIIEKNNIMGVLHGHIHGREQVPIGKKKCRMIGVGALFSRNYSNVNSQFNIIRLNPFVFREISTYLYRADDRISGDAWIKISQEEERDENYFSGTGFSDVYGKLLRKLSYEEILNNVVMQIKCSYEEFVDDLEGYFQNNNLSIGEKKFTYYELADLWEKTKVPENLYFNHGTYFKVKDRGKKEGKMVHGIQLIAHQLKEKPTSNKAVLTTYSMDTVAKMLKGEEYLPSLLSVQFSQSMDGRTMYVYMYLRALEAERFLKINICEIKWLLEQLREQNVLFDKVDVAISAFRVQRREKFNCFMKADIDIMGQTDMDCLVYDGDIKKICQILEEKKDALETITNANGIKVLSDAIKASGKSLKGYKYNPIVIEKLDEITEIYKKLDGIHAKGSIRTKKEEKCEEELMQKIDEVLDELRKGDNWKNDNG